MSTPSVCIRQIPPEETKPLRHAVLWPSVSLDNQLMDYDYFPTTVHFGAFLDPSSDSFTSVSSSRLVGILTLVHASYPTTAALPSSISSLRGKFHSEIQLHKVAVEEGLRGLGIGKILVLHAIEYVKNEMGRRSIVDNDDDKALKTITNEGDKKCLLFWNSRITAQHFYRRLGGQVLDEKTIESRGPLGDAQPEPQIRMGLVI